jgi:hypothetical protein
LRKAFALPYDPAFTDEATLVERLGRGGDLGGGEERNIKVTTPFDLKVRRSSSANVLSQASRLVCFYRMATTDIRDLSLDEVK